MLPPEAASYFQQLLPPSELTQLLEIQISFDHVVYRFQRGQALAEIELTHPSTCAAPDGPMCLRRGRTSGPGADALSRDAHDALADALRQSRDAPKWVEVASADNRPPEYWLPVAEALYLILIAGLLVALWRCRRQILSADAIVPVALAASALLLRCIAKEGPADIRPVLFNTGLGRAGWDALLHLVFRVLPPQDETIWTVNRIAGALSVPLLYALLRSRFSDRTVAVAGAAALAVTPLLVRFSASDTPYILLCAAFLGALVAYDRYAESQSTGAFALALALLTVAMQLRPEGPWLIVPALLVALALPARTGARAWKLRPSLALCALAFVAINALATAWAFTGHAEKSNLAGTSCWSDLCSAVRGPTLRARRGSCWRSLSSVPSLLSIDTNVRRSSGWRRLSLPCRSMLLRLANTRTWRCIAASHSRYRSPRRWSDRTGRRSTSTQTRGTTSRRCTWPAA